MSKIDNAVASILPAKERPQVASCPFCRSGAVRGVREDDGADGEPGYFMIECTSCLCTGPKGATLRDAELKWNARH